MSEDLVKLLDPPGSCLYHYTRLCTVVEHILPSGRIKMNPFSRMRDPRESKELNPVGAAGPAGSTLEGTRRFPAIHAKSRRVKNQVKVLSLTRDDSVSAMSRVRSSGAGSLTRDCGSSTATTIAESVSASTARTSPEC
jgi:hypothetical protein